LPRRLQAPELNHDAQQHMQVVFRTDASLQIGTGHVMRCLTLADALRECGVWCSFVCRPHQGHLLAIIAQRGHHVLPLPELHEDAEPNRNSTVHTQWLGTDWATDAQDTQNVLSAHAGGEPVDWLVVDHYALDVRWEETLRPQAKRIMVIDDLADRPHACNLLLDQTFGRRAADYHSLAPECCNLLCGSQYALLRPEFAVLREYSLKRRAQPVLKELLITMGGVDKDNLTGDVLRALQHFSLPEDCRVTVVMGQTAPWLKDVQDLASVIPTQTRVLVGVSNMAQLMADSDLAIGAAGATSWERCCLGLPSIMIVVADNQLEVAKRLEEVGAALLCMSDQGLSKQLAVLLNALCDDTEQIALLSEAAVKVTDGVGTYAVLAQMGMQLA
jgi:UDP-2,4-diacetamido-2,4,6-trideoxy-beta-L-altropyranose hydrolase